MGEGEAWAGWPQHGLPRAQATSPSPALPCGCLCPTVGGAVPVPMAVASWAGGLAPCSFVSVWLGGGRPCT